MSDDEKKPARKPLTLKGAQPGEVKQTFSHGRTNKVAVEVKRRRKLVKPGETPPPAEPAPAPPPWPLSPEPVSVVSTSQRHRSICSVPTRLPLTLITSSERPWNVYPGTLAELLFLAVAFAVFTPRARAAGTGAASCFLATSPCTNPPAPHGQYEAANLARTPRQGGFAFNTPSPQLAASPKTVSARLGYGAVITTSLVSLATAQRTQGNG